MFAKDALIQQPSLLQLHLRRRMQQQRLCSNENHHIAAMTPAQVERLADPLTQYPHSPVTSTTSSPTFRHHQAQHAGSDHQQNGDDARMTAGGPRLVSPHGTRRARSGLPLHADASMPPPSIPSSLFLLSTPAQPDIDSCASRKKARSALSRRSALIAIIDETLRIVSDDEDDNDLIFGSDQSC